MLLSAYEILDVSEDSNEADWKEAFLKKVKSHHPDHGGRSEDFIVVKRAYETLLNPELRERTGQVRQFERPREQLNPALSRGMTQLLENIDVLKRIHKL